MLGRLFERLLARRRRKLYEPALALAAEGRPPEAVAVALTPQRPEDAALVEDLILDALRRATGPAAKTLALAAERLGLVARALERLASPDARTRVRALEALGALRAPSSVHRLLVQLKREKELKLDVLAALAAIGDKSTLPEFAATAKDLPDEALPGLASLMLEFGQEAYASLLPVINQRPAAFPPETLAELLRLAAERAKR